VTRAFTLGYLPCVRDTPIRVRIPDELRALVVDAADRDRLNQSAWIREVLAAVASSPLSLPQILDVLRSAPPAGINGHHRWKSPNPQMGASVVARSCLHRADLIERFPTFNRCAGCGREWPR